MKSASKSIAIAALAFCFCFLLAGCGEKMTDQKFADVAATIYDNVQANWDHQSGESWATYYERRIAEACAKHNTSPAAWNKKMKEVMEHPEKFDKVIDKDVLASLIEWENQRQATK